MKSQSKSFIYVIRRLIYGLLAAYDCLFGRENSVAILVFHSIDEGNWFFGNSVSQIEAYLKELSRHYKIISLSEMLDVVQKKKHYMEKVLAISFDDGYKNLLSVAPAFRDLNIRPTVFALSNPDKANRSQLESENHLLSDTDLNLLHKMFGWEIGSHTATHENLTKLTDKELKKQIHDSKIKLEEIIGSPVRFFAYPKGGHNEKVVEHVKKAGYHAAFTMDNKEITLLGDIHRIPRVGINRTHSPSEILHSLSPSAVSLRKFTAKIIRRIW